MNKHQRLSRRKNLFGAVSLAKQSLLLLFTLAVTACASIPQSQPNSTAKPVLVEERVIVDGKLLPLPEEPTIRAESLPASLMASPVVAKLQVSADRQRRAGNLDSAANSLERALRIEPRNARLWNRLADIRFEQKEWQQSAQLAAKSNTLLRNSDVALRRQNWYLMVNAYEAIGDTVKAEKYRQKLIR